MKEAFEWIVAPEMMNRRTFEGQQSPCIAVVEASLDHVARSCDASAAALGFRGSLAALDEPLISRGEV